jgi:hypothetical protein
LLLALPLANQPTIINGQTACALGYPFTPNGPRRLLSALRYILQRRAVVVAIGIGADISWLAEFDDLVENDPSATSARIFAVMQNTRET